MHVAVFPSRPEKPGELSILAFMSSTSHCAALFASMVRSISALPIPRSVTTQLELPDVPVIDALTGGTFSNSITVEGEQDAIAASKQSWPSAAKTPQSEGPVVFCRSGCDAPPHEVRRTPINNAGIIAVSMDSRMGGRC